MKTHHCAEDYESDEETEEEHPNEDDGRSPDYQSHDYGVSYVQMRAPKTAAYYISPIEIGLL